MFGRGSRERKLDGLTFSPPLDRAHDTAYYQNQRQALLKRHGIDLEESDPASTPKKLDRKKAEEIMGGKQGLLTWRDKNRKKLAYSVAGTNSYMAVEVIRGTGYGFSCDWWSLGVIMYEVRPLLRPPRRPPPRELPLTNPLRQVQCLYGYPPFVSSSRQQTRQKILVRRASPHSSALARRPC